MDPSRAGFAPGPEGAILNGKLVRGLPLLALGSLVLAALHAAACGPASIEGDPLPLRLPDRVTSSPDVDAGEGDATVTPPPTDAATTLPDAADAADAADASRTLRAFVTSTTTNGNLGGLAGADAKCAALATARGFTGTFRAWLSVEGTTAASRITSAGPWHLVTGELVAATKAELVSGTLQHAVNKDETGKVAPLAEDRAWTATNAAGAYAGPSCSGWTSTGGGGVVGEAEHKDGKWTALTAEACTEVNRLYCFEL